MISKWEEKSFEAMLHVHGPEGAGEFETRPSGYRKPLTFLSLEGLPLLGANLFYRIYPSGIPDKTVESTVL